MSFSATPKRQEPYSSDQHDSLIKTPRQLITVVVLAFVFPSF